MGMRVGYVLGPASSGVREYSGDNQRLWSLIDLDLNPKSTNFCCVIMGMSLTSLCLSFLICKIMKDNEKSPPHRVGERMKKMCV